MCRYLWFCFFFLFVKTKININYMLPAKNYTQKPRELAIEADRQCGRQRVLAFESIWKHLKNEKKHFSKLQLILKLKFQFTKTMLTVFSFNLCIENSMTNMISCFECQKWIHINNIYAEHTILQSNCWKQTNLILN